MGHDTKRGRGKPPRPFTSFEQADIDMAEQRRRWEVWAGAAHCGRAAYELSIALANRYMGTLGDPAFMGFRNAFRSYCNLWRGRHLSEYWEFPDSANPQEGLPSIQNHNAVVQALGFTDAMDMARRFVEGAMYSFVPAARSSPSGKRIPTKVVLGLGPGDDPRGYGRKLLPVRYADAVTQKDLLSCNINESLLSAQLSALRMDCRGEDVVDAQFRHEMLTLLQLHVQLYDTGGIDWSGWCWHPMFNEALPELFSMHQYEVESGRFSSESTLYRFVAFLRLRREAGGAAGFPSLLYCEFPDCTNRLFFWDGTVREVAGGARRKGTKAPHTCGVHSTEEIEAWRKRRQRARKRQDSENA